MGISIKDILKAEEIDKLFKSIDRHEDIKTKIDSIDEFPDTLYHGSNKLYQDELTDIQKINPFINKKITRDFSSGFYLTSSIEQAHNQGVSKQPFMKAKINQKKLMNSQEKIVEDGHEPLIVAYTVNKDRLEQYFLENPDKKLLLFNKKFISIECSKFILNNRLGKDFSSIWRGSLNNLLSEYSMIQGPLADGKMGLSIEHFKKASSDIERENLFKDFMREISKDFSFGDGDQTSFHDKELIEQVLTVREIIEYPKDESNLEK